MVNFTTDQIREIMYKPERIRNFSVIAHVDHGKTTLTDSLIAKAGIIAMKGAGEQRYMSSGTEEIKRGITIKSAGVSLYFEIPDPFTKEKEGTLFNLIDSPGHVDFSSEVTAALRVTDGALVVVDSVEGVCVQTETVLRQAMQEKIRPVLFINKIDRKILEHQVESEDIYNGLQKTIENFNLIVSTYEHEDMGSLLVEPTLGNVAFGSGKDCWAFTLHKFAELYAAKLNIEKEKLVGKFWGENYYDSTTKTWTTSSLDSEGKLLPRGFCKFIMDPIITIARCAIQNDISKLRDICGKMGIELTQNEWELTGKELNRCIMQKWINAADCLLEMIVNHLPSPKTAQKYRYSYLYEGEKDDPAAVAIRECDINGPLMMYISKMIPSSDSGKFYAFGRVFSGKAASGQKVRMLGPNYKPGSNVDVFHGNINRTVIMMGKKTEFVPDIPCGNTGALIGIDKYLAKNGTVTDSETSQNIRTMKFSVSPVVRIALQPKNPMDLPKLVEGMRKLAKTDQLVVCSCDEQTGQNIIAGSGALHLEVCIADLKEQYAQIEIVQSNPLVSYCETVTEISEVCMAKSANKLNRLYCSAEPIGPELSAAIESGEVSLKLDKKDLSSLLIDRFDFDKNEVSRIWAFGPDQEGPNILMNSTEASQYMKEIKDSVVTGFEAATSCGVLCDEATRSIMYKITETVVHPDGSHRGGAQIIPTMKRALYASQLTAQPRIQEPIYFVEIMCPASFTGTVYNVLSLKRGTIEEEISQAGSNIVSFKGFLPVAESFGNPLLTLGFTEYLRGQTLGQAFPSLSFSHWETLTDNPLSTTENRATKIVSSIRKRKGMSEKIPGVEEYRDKL